MPYKALCILILLYGLPFYSKAQNGCQHVEFKEIVKDSIYLEDPITGKLELKTFEKLQRLFTKEDVEIFCMSQVNKPAQNDGFREKSAKSFHAVIDSFKSLSRSFYSILPAGVYTFELRKTLISKEGELVYYEILFPNKYPFNVKRVNAPTCLSQIEPSLTRILYNQFRFHLYNSGPWIPARHKARAVHAYFDKPIEITVEIK